VGVALPDADALEVEVELADEVADDVAVDELVLDDEGLLEAEDDAVDELVADEVELPLDVALVDAVGETAPTLRPWPSLRTWRWTRKTP
jgi:hypothetical protein